VAAALGNTISAFGSLKKLNHLQPPLFYRLNSYFSFTAHAKRVDLDGRSKTKFEAFSERVHGQHGNLQWLVTKQNYN
jgi:hypothetical protein